MAGREGLWIDSGQAREFSGKIGSGVSSVQGLIGQITAMIDGLYWEGEDKLRFVADWQGNLRPQANQALQTMQESADELARRAAAQEELSNRGH